MTGREAERRTRSAGRSARGAQSHSGGVNTPESDRPSAGTTDPEDAQAHPGWEVYPCECDEGEYPRAEDVYDPGGMGHDW